MSVASCVKEESRGKGGKGREGYGEASGVDPEAEGGVWGRLCSSAREG